MKGHSSQIDNNKPSYHAHFSVKKPSLDQHKVWLNISIGIAVLIVFVLVFYASQGTGVGKASGQAGDFYFATCKKSDWANGGTYYLTKNLGPPDADAGGDCIVITGNNIVLNCLGHSITGNKIAKSDAIRVKGLNNIVKNCPIANFYNGIVVETGKTNHLATNNYIGTAAWLPS